MSLEYGRKSEFQTEKPVNLMLRGASRHVGLNTERCISAWYRSFVLFPLRLVSHAREPLTSAAASRLHVIFGWRTWGTSVPVTCRTPPAPQLSVRSCWSRNPEGTPHLDSFPSLVCRPTWEGPVVWRTEPSTCASCPLAETTERRLFYFIFFFPGDEGKLYTWRNEW